MEDFQNEFLNYLWDVVYKSTSWPRTDDDLDLAVWEHEKWFIDLARRVVEHLGGMPEDGVLIEDINDTRSNGGCLCYEPGELLVTFRANCEDDWIHTTTLYLDEDDLLGVEET